MNGNMKWSEIYEVIKTAERAQATLENVKLLLANEKLLDGEKVELVSALLGVVEK